jgi:hypothetical protein
MHSLSHNTNCFGLPQEHAAFGASRRVSFIFTQRRSRDIIYCIFGFGQGLLRAAWAALGCFGLLVLLHQQPSVLN